MSTNEFKDVIRYEGLETGLNVSLRSGQLAFASDTKRMTRKYASGNFYHWTPDEEWDPGATGISYTNSSYPSITTVQQGLDAALANGEYYADLGVTGVPVWGDGIIDNYVSVVGSAVYSSDGHVYLMDEAGFTGTATLAGCRFVINPVPIADNIRFVHGGANVSDYASIGYTGSGSANDAELHIKTVAGAAGNTTHINIQASYGKIKLTAGTGGGNQNGILLTGRDANGVYYQVAAAGKYRDLYADENGDLVVAGSDRNTRYEQGSFTLQLDVINDVDSGGQSSGTAYYEVQGDFVHLYIPWLYSYSKSASLGITGLPSSLLPSASVNQFVIVRDEGQLFSAAVRPARISIATNGWLRCYCEEVSGSLIKYGSSGFGTTGYKGIESQCVSYRL